MTSTTRPMTAYLIRKCRKPLATAALLTAYLLAQPITAQTPNQASAARVPNDKMTAIETPAQPDAIELGTGPLPGATVAESWHSQYGSKFARNVTVATLRPFLPDPSKASGAAVIVAPGGGLRTLSMENEGWNVARALSDKAVAPFVLKPPLTQPRETPDPSAPPSPRRGGPAGGPPATRPSPAEMASRIAPQIADAEA